MVVSSAPCDHETEDAMPVLRKRLGGSSQVPIRAEGPAIHGQPLPCSGRPTREGVRRSRNGPPSRDETVRPRDRGRSRYDYYEEASARPPRDPSSRTDQEAGCDSGYPFSVKPFTLDILACCWPLSHHLTQHQYPSPPVCSQSLQCSPDSHR